MKRIILTTLFIFLISSCQLYNEIADEYYQSNLDLPLYYGDELQLDLNSHHDIYFQIGQYCKSIISYATEDEENWQSPKQTIKRGKGDCEDFAILYLNILYYNTGEKANIILVHSPTRKVISGGRVNHCIVELEDGTQIEPQSGREVDYVVKYRYTFNEVFK